jgi:4-carboxymuconolactone decarboxylase
MVTNNMKEEPTNARKSFGDIAPHLAEITDKVLFGEVWENLALSPRDRSLATITSLISLYRVNELPFHLKRALENGVTQDEVIGAITHLAFYAGWPPAMTALQIARKGLRGSRAMSAWDQAELRKITQADDPHIAPFREDGKNLWHADVDLAGRR